MPPRVRSARATNRTLSAVVVVPSELGAAFGTNPGSRRGSGRCLSVVTRWLRRRRVEATAAAGCHGLGTGLGTEHRETDANKRDGVKQAGRLNAADMEI